MVQEHMIQHQILFIDLDGTILDASSRLYQIHQETLKSLGINTLYSREEYLALKRTRTPEEKIISFIPESQKRDFYLQQQEKHMEDWAYLEKDILFPWSKAALEQLRKQNRIILCTRRKNAEFLLRQLQHFGLKELFHDTIISFDKKAEKIKRHPSFVKEKAVIIGDTEADIETGKLLGIKTVAVLSGYRNKEFLLKYQPDLIIENIQELVETRIIVLT